MLLGSPGARQAQSHTLRPKAAGEDLRSAGPKRERKEGLGGATHPPLHCTTGSSARGGRAGCWKRRGAAGKRRWGQPTRPRAPQEGRPPGSTASRATRVKVLMAKDEERSYWGHARENANCAKAPGAVGHARGTGTASCPVPPASPRAAQPGSGHFQTKPRRGNLPPGVRALELAHPLPALGKEDCADFFKCQTIRKKAGWRLLPTTEKLPTQGRELEAQTLFAQIQHICLVCKGWKRNQPCRNTGFVKLRLLLRTLSQKKKKKCVLKSLKIALR